MGDPEVPKPLVADHRHRFGIDLFTKIRKSKFILRLVWVAQQLSKLVIVATIINYLAEAPQRQKAKEFQAWQVINSARSGNGGRTLALHDLIADGVSLEGIDLRGAALPNIDLRGVNLTNANLSHAVLEHADFSCGGQFIWWTFKACSHQTLLDHADLSRSKIDDANFAHSSLWKALLDGTSFTPEDNPEWVIGHVSFKSAELAARLINLTLDYVDFYKSHC